MDQAGSVASVPIFVVSAKPICRFLRILRSEIEVSETGIVESKVEALVDNLAMAVMQADNLAADSPEYRVLSETVAYTLDLVDLGLSAESDAFDSLPPPRAR
jgi:hypothetical protein